MVLALVFGASVAPRAAQPPATAAFTVLVFARTTGFRHASIPDGIAAVKTLGAEYGFAVEATEDAARFTDATLAKYKVVVFLSTTGDVLDPDEKAAFERYIRSGGGFVGIHSASDTEYGWSWYGRLVGTYFESHPAIQQATVHVVDREHPATRPLPEVWSRIDEWYDFRTNPRGKVHVLATLDEKTYTGGTMGADHPIAWCQNFDGAEAGTRQWATPLRATRTLCFSFTSGAASRAVLASVVEAAPPGRRIAIEVNRLDQNIRRLRIHHALMPMSAPRT